MRITVKLLCEKGACAAQVETFAKLWPKGCTVSLSVARRALAAGLDLQWAASNLLCATARKVYAAAMAEADKVYAAAMAEAFAAACRLHDKEA